MLGEEIFGLDACLSEDSPQRSFRHITWVVRDGGVAISGGVVPYFVAPGSLPAGM